MGDVSEETRAHSFYTTLARVSFVLAVDYFQLLTARLIAAPFVHYNKELSIQNVQ